ncbi:MAG TPA: ABC transporter permease subunit [Acidimicrobiales bacterium]|nr:ABC transporter permease subunit [Acidimicrobiales bacterium]
MNFLSKVGDFLTSGANWSGPDGFLTQLVTQVEVSAIAIVAAALVGVALGTFLSHTRRGGFLAVNSANAARAIPSFSLVVLIAIQPAIVRLQQGGFVATAITMFALAVPPILTNTYTGVRGVDDDVRSAAMGMGMTTAQLVRRVELPLALPLVVAGVRTAAVEVVATATLGAYVGVIDLGFDIFAGLDTNNGVETFAGAALVAALALVVDLVFLVAAWAVTPRNIQRHGPILRPV